MLQACKNMIEQFNIGFKGNYFFWLYAIALIYLFMDRSKKRYKLAVPSLILTVLILNPICYKYIWTRTIGYAYWRLFWAIPIIPVIAVAATDAVSKIKNSLVKVLAAIIIISVCYKSGALVYSNPETTFSKSENAYKLSGYAVSVTNWLTDHSDSPRVVNDITIATYAIQIHPNIRQAFGRWGLGNEQSRTGRLFITHFSNGHIWPDTTFDWAGVRGVMKAEGYDYLVVPMDAPAEVEPDGNPLIVGSGYKLKAFVDGYGIYSVSGE